MLQDHLRPEACVHVCRRMNLVSYQHSCFVLACVYVFVWCTDNHQWSVITLALTSCCFMMRSSGSSAQDQIQKSCLCLDLTDKVQTRSWSSSFPSSGRALTSCSARSQINEDVKESSNDPTFNVWLKSLWLLAPSQQRHGFLTHSLTFEATRRLW